MLILSTVNQSLEIILAGTVTTNQADWTAHYADDASGTLTEGSSNGVTNNATSVTMVAAPGASTKRMIKNLTVYNADTASITFTISLNDNGTKRVILKKTLGAATQRIYDSTAANGSGDVIGPASATGDNIAVFDGSTGKLLKDGGATIASKANLASPTFTGTVTLPTTVLGEASFQLDTTLSGAGKWSGITETGIAGATLTFGQVCYLNSSSKRVLAKADAATTSGPVKVGVCVLAAAGDTSATEILVYGKIYIATHGITIGAPYYISGATAGAITGTAPTTTDHVTKIIGVANTANELSVNPDISRYTHV